MNLTKSCTHVLWRKISDLIRKVFFLINQTFYTVYVSSKAVRSAFFTMDKRTPSSVSCGCFIPGNWSHGNDGPTFLCEYKRPSGRPVRFTLDSGYQVVSTLLKLLLNTVLRQTLVSARLWTLLGNSIETYS